MEDNFTPALMQTLAFEGGLQNDGEVYSNRGVEQKVYNAYAKQNKLPAKDVKDLKWGELKSFYKDNYWDGPGLDKLGSKPVSELLFDFGVNAGPATAIKRLQEIVQTKPDGIIGPKTRKALSKYIEKNGESAVIQNLLNARAVHYNDLYQANPNRNAKYIAGWINRVEALKRKYLK